MNETQKMQAMTAGAVPTPTCQHETKSANDDGTWSCESCWETVPAPTQAETLARVTGSVSATVTHETVMPDGSIRTDSVDSWTRDPAPMTEAHTQALELLRGVVDSAHVDHAEALVASGKAAWYFDPQHADVIGLISRATERALAVVYVSEEDVEFAEEFFQTV